MTVWAPRIISAMGRCSAAWGCFIRNPTSRWTWVVRAVGEGALAVLAEDQPAVFQVAKGEPDGYAADLESPAELMLAGDGKGVSLRPAEDFLGQSRHKSCTGSRTPELDHATYNVQVR